MREREGGGGERGGGRDEEGGREEEGGGAPVIMKGDRASKRTTGIIIRERDIPICCLSTQAEIRKR